MEVSASQLCLASSVEDASMGEADTGESRGVKRTLDEDEDYD